LHVRFDATPAVLPFIEDERRKYELSRIPQNDRVTSRVTSRVTDKVTDKVTGKVTGKVICDVTGNAATIIDIIRENPNITVGQLMSILSMSDAGVRKIMRQLKSDGLIRRVGPDKGGHWEVIDK